MTEVVVDVTELQRMAADQNELARDILETEGKINAILVKSDMVDYTGWYRDFVRNFSKLSLRSLINLDIHPSRWKPYHLSFLCTFYSLFEKMDRIVTNIKEFKEVPRKEQIQRYKFWLCCVFYLAVVAVEDHDIDIDVKFKFYFMDYLDEHFRNKQTNPFTRDYIKLVTNVFNSEVVWLMKIGVCSDLILHKDKTTTTM